MLIRKKNNRPDTDNILKVTIALSVAVHAMFFIKMPFASDMSGQVYLDSQKASITVINYSSVYLKPGEIEALKKIKTVNGDVPVPGKENKNIESGEDKSAGVSLSAEASMERDTYETSILKRIHRAKYYPTYARKMKYEGIVKIRFTLSREGRLLDAKIIEKCHFDILNKAGIKTIENSGPFPEFPALLSRETDKVDFTVEIDYDREIKT